MYGRYKTNYDKVVEFNTEAGKPTAVGWDNLNCYQAMNLIKEEYYELADAIRYPNVATPVAARASIIKEACDVLYTVYGLLAVIGVDADEAFEAVHDSNMSKLTDGKPRINEEGKFLKGPNYKPPNMERFVS